ncbi:DNA mismatch repair protein MutS [Nitzschia inconspicua]|uniref:DNA mismatch repair protein MutS n=1 Tax=Nitzschia inconspicua TaxID=303405 RepID=A0A9K3KE74_9STRA|nr:DNA mismatch repair protein MutS [Nitzschia inconspicua]
MDEACTSYRDHPSIVRGSQESVSSRNHHLGGRENHSIAADVPSDRSHVSTESRVRHYYHHPDDDRSFFFSRTQNAQSYDEGSCKGRAPARAMEVFNACTGSVRSNRSARSRTSSIRSHRIIRGSNASRRDPVTMDTPGMSILSVVFEGSNVAFCCYNEDRNEILMENCQASGYETQSLVERFLQVTQPTLVLVSTRIINNAPLLQMVTTAPLLLATNEARIDGGKNHTSQESSQKDKFTPSASTIPYRVMKSGSYDLRGCRANILQKLRVTSLSKEPSTGRAGSERLYQTSDPTRQFPSSSAPEESTAFEPSRYHYLAAAIDFDSKALVKALGSLLSYLETSVFQLDGGIIRINRIVEAKISDCMIISPTTFAALHIFAEETHPLIGKKNGNSKEGFSLYSLLDRTSSKGGRKLLKNWMLKPLNNLEAINTRLDCIELFLKPILQATVGVLCSLLKKVGPVDSIIIRIQKCTTKPKDFLMLNSSLYAMISLSNVIRNDILTTIHSIPDLSTRRCFNFFSNILEEFNIQSMLRLRERISAVVDEEATMTRDLHTQKVAIRYGFDEQLDAWRDQYEDLDRTLEGVGKVLYQQYPQLDGLDVMFMPQIGFLVGLRQELVKLAEVQLPHDFEHIFDEDGLAFFKCSEMRELDEEIGDLDGIIKDTENMILSELEDDILDCENELQECFTAISTLDCLLSLTECAGDLGFTRPQMIDTNSADNQSKESHVIYAKEARHPLLEVISDHEFVPNDIRMDEQDRIIVVTGPNYSGKSCYLRQIGLLVYMAHIGSFVPASKAVIAITDQIFARFSSVETWSRPQSGYQQECTEVASVFQKATSKSLVLLDEVGKGTHPASGIAILGATLKKLGRMRCNTACSTHFLELFTMDILKDKENGICARKMTVMLPDEKDNDNVVPLFKLEDGVALSSAGLACAKHAGVENDVIERAREIIDMMRKNEPIKPLPELTGEPSFSEEEVDLFLHFTSIEDWETASEDDLRLLIQKVSKVDP